MTNHIHATDDYSSWSTTGGYDVTNGSFNYDLNNGTGGYLNETFNNQT